MRRGIAGPRELELWRMQVAALEVRNHVCLVLSTRRRGDQLTASAVTLSRLKASLVDRSLARRILYGEREGGVPTRAEAEVQAGSEAAAEAVVEAEVDRFLAAFGGQAANPNPNPNPNPSPNPNPNPNPKPSRNPTPIAGDLLPRQGAPQRQARRRRCQGAPRPCNPHPHPYPYP